VGEGETFPFFLKTVAAQLVISSIEQTRTGSNLPSIERQKNSAGKNPLPGGEDPGEGVLSMAQSAPHNTI
jgi:hypothetical protein